MRVMIASEHLKVSQILEEAVQGENGTVIVGQSNNLSKTLNLARRLRPDIAIIDCYLPHAVGVENIPLSRAGGLDAAQIISDEIPNTRVMVLNNLDTVRLPESGWNSDTVVSFARETIGNSLPLALRDLSGLPRTGPVFASVEVKRKSRPGQNRSKLVDEVVLFGGVGILSGLIMMLTLILFIPGIFVAVLGGIMVGSGFLTKLILGRLGKEGKA